MVGVAAAHGVEADALMGKVDFAAHQSMKPVFSDREGLSEQRYVALVVASAQVDHRSLEGGVEVELERSGELAAVGSGFSSGSCFATVSGNITCGNDRQAGEVGAMVALPDLALPEGVEAFYGVLEAMFARWGEHWGHLQGETQAAHATDRIGELVRTLKEAGVVELGVRGQPFAAPAIPKGFEGGLCSRMLHHPGIGQRPVQAGGGEYRNQGTSSDLQVLNEVEGVQLGLTIGETGQIPAFWRCRPTLPMRAIQGAVTIEHPVNRRARGNLVKRGVLLQCQADRVGSVLAEDAVFT